MSKNPHAPYVEALTKNGDWAALVRYWIAHQYVPALAAAIGLLRRRSLAGQAEWQPWVEFLEQVQQNPLDPRIQPPAGAEECLSPEERGTIGLVLLSPRSVLCELAAQAPVGQQAQLLQLGIQAATQAGQLSTALEDPASGALFTRVLARGFREAGDLKAARASYEEGLGIYRELAAKRPEVYRPEVAMTLNNLGNVQRALNELEAARASYEEALNIRRELAADRPEVYRPEVAMTLNNLGTVQSDLNELEAARAGYEEALNIRRELAAKRPEVYRPYVATTLNNLGNVQRDLNELEAARASFEEGLGIDRELAALRPEVNPPYVATTLNNLGLVQHALNELEAARASYEEALNIRRELAAKRPEVYRPEVG